MPNKLATKAERRFSDHKCRVISGRSREGGCTLFPTPIAKVARLAIRFKDPLVSYRSVRPAPRFAGRERECIERN
jgi:hypothetical protein